MRRVLWLLTLVGCNEIYGLEPTTVRDLEPPPCSTVQFGPPRELADFAGGDREFDPQLSADGNEIWFTANTAETNNSYLMLRGTRASATDRYTMEVVDLAGKNPVSSYDAALTADGLRMMFLVKEIPTTLFEGVRRTATQFPFDDVVLVNGFSQFRSGLHAFDLTWDGLRIYFVVPETIDGRQEGVLWFGRRADRNMPFGDFQRMFEVAHFPTISGDELEIFHTNFVNTLSDRRLYRRVRASRDEMFGPPELVLDDGGDPDIAPTSSTMVVSRDGGLAILERRCD